MIRDHTISIDYEIIRGDEEHEFTVEGLFRDGQLESWAFPDLASDIELTESELEHITEKLFEKEREG